MAQTFTSPTNPPANAGRVMLSHTTHRYIYHIPFLVGTQGHLHTQIGGIYRHSDKATTSRCTQIKVRHEVRHKQIKVLDIRTPAITQPLLSMEIVEAQRHRRETDTVVMLSQGQIGHVK